MPTYEYRCSACEHEFERFQKISDRPVRTCPQCGRRRVRRLISSGGGLVFKGPGFYATDYRKDAGGAKPEPKPESGSGKGAGPTKKSDGVGKASNGGDA